ncbi:hypothetical protein RhiirA1_480397 [Rhizophagus irregularis]|uniref:Uncharacterized protein n=1 Tax=Rhizophagus irregularis TaxID=588596 RepID=A0A2N0QPE2_9GLOM|nr:hypothetical protein RhiirA1_480397 [Rhizophagus irregularis]
MDELTINEGTKIRFGFSLQLLGIGYIEFGFQFLGLDIWISAFYSWGLDVQVSAFGFDFWFLGFGYMSFDFRLNFEYMDKFLLQIFGWIFLWTSIEWVGFESSKL